MNGLETLPVLKAPPPRPLLPPPDPNAPSPQPPAAPGAQGGSGRWAIGLAIILLVSGALALGVWRHYQQHNRVAAFTDQQADFVPGVRVEQVTQRLGRVHVTLPGRPSPSSKRTSMGAPAGMWQNALSTLAITSRRGSRSPILPDPRSRTRLPNIATGCSKRRRRNAKPRPSAPWRGSPRYVLLFLPSRAGTRRNRGR